MNAVSAGSTFREAGGGGVPGTAVARAWAQDRAGHDRDLDRHAAEAVSRFADPATHRAALPTLATWLCRQGRFADALMLLERHRRTGPDTASCRLLEAWCRREIVGQRASLAPLRRAFALDPTDAAVQCACLRGLVEAGEIVEAVRVGNTLLRSARDRTALREALDLIEPDWSVFGDVRRVGQRIEGWIMWRGGAPSRRLAVTVDGEPAEWVIEAPRGGAGAGEAVVVDLAAPWPDDATVVDLRDAASGRTLRGSPLVDEAALGDLPEGDTSAQVTIIVPVYDNSVATRACFESLLDDDCSVPRRILAVDDASPDPAIRVMLDRLARSGAIELLRNPANLGFIRAVNRALDRITDEDVVLLNADTVVPRQWLERLQAVARGRGIGTVTPLSNNGELVSMPQPFRANPLPDRTRLAEIDEELRRLDHPAVDMPNGVGFCMYVRNAALRAVGRLDETRYERGYLEEVDYCLRIREAGFRNVCAPNVLVGHAGEASFGAGKRALVIANQAALLRRWPDIEADTAAFVLRDPLQPLRRALAWTMAQPRAKSRLVVGAPGAWRAARDLLAGTVAAEDAVVLSVEGMEPDAWTLDIGDLSSVPLPPELADRPPSEALGVIVDHFGIRDVLLLHEPALDWVSRLNWGEIGMDVDILPVSAEVLPPADEADAWPHAAAYAEARAVLSPCSWAVEALEDALGGADVRDVSASMPAAVRGRVRTGAGRIGILPSGRPGEAAAIAALGRELRQRGSGLELVLFGAIDDDVRLFAVGNIFVTGPLQAGEMGSALALHPCSGLVLSHVGDGLIAPGAALAREAGLPVAAVRAPATRDFLDRAGCLELGADWSPARVAEALERFAGRAGGAGEPGAFNRPGRLELAVSS